MPFRPQKPVKSFDTVAPGSPATLELGSAQVYSDIAMEYKSANGVNGVVPADRATMEAEINRVEMLLNGTPQIDLTPVELFYFDDFFGMPVENGLLNLSFVRQVFRRPDQALGSVLFVPSGASFDLRVSIDGAATSPDLTATQWSQPAAAQAFSNRFISTTRHQVRATGAGIHRDTFRGTGRNIIAMHMFSQNVNSVRIRRSDRTLWDIDKNRLDNAYKRQGFNPQASVYTVSPVYKHALLGDAWAAQTSQGQIVDFELEIDMAAAETFDMIVEEIGPIKA